MTFRLEDQLTNIVVMYQNVQHHESVLANLDTNGREMLDSLTESGLNEDLRTALAAALEACHEAQEAASAHKDAVESVQHALEACRLAI